MKKYLLINNYTCYAYDDDDLTSNVYTLGDYDTVAECLEVAKSEIRGQAEENAENMFELDDTDEEIIAQAKQEYIDRYCEGQSDFEVGEDGFFRPGATRYILEHWYAGGSYRVENQFMVVRIF